MLIFLIKIFLGDDFMIYNKEQIDLYLKKLEYNDEIKIDYDT